MNDKLKEVIENVISTYLEENIDEDAVSFLFDKFGLELYDIIDPEDLAIEITNRLCSENRVLEFLPTPLIGNSLKNEGMQCPKCYRPYGRWMSLSGGWLDDSDVSKPGSKIIIIEDL